MLEWEILIDLRGISLLGDRTHHVEWEEQWRLCHQDCWLYIPFYPIISQMSCLLVIMWGIYIYILCMYNMYTCMYIYIHTQCALCNIYLYIYTYVYVVNIFSSSYMLHIPLYPKYITIFLVGSLCSRANPDFLVEELLGKVDDATIGQAIASSTWWAESDRRVPGDN